MATAVYQGDGAEDACLKHSWTKIHDIARHSNGAEPRLHNIQILGENIYDTSSFVIDRHRCHRHLNLLRPTGIKCTHISPHTSRSRNAHALPSSPAHGHVNAVNTRHSSPAPTTKREGNEGKDLSRSTGVTRRAANPENKGRRQAHASTASLQLRPMRLLILVPSARLLRAWPDPQSPTPFAPDPVPAKRMNVAPSNGAPPPHPHPHKTRLVRRVLADAKSTCIPTSAYSETQDCLPHSARPGSPAHGSLQALQATSLRKGGRRGSGKKQRDRKSHSPSIPPKILIAPNPPFSPKTTSASPPPPYYTPPPTIHITANPLRPPAPRGSSAAIVLLMPGLSAPPEEDAEGMDAAEGKARIRAGEAAGLPLVEGAAAGVKEFGGVVTGATGAAAQREGFSSLLVFARAALGLGEGDRARRRNQRVKSREMARKETSTIAVLPRAECTRGGLWHASAPLRTRRFLPPRSSKYRALRTLEDKARHTRSHSAHVHPVPTSFPLPSHCCGLGTCTYAPAVAGGVLLVVTHSNCLQRKDGYMRAHPSCAHTRSRTLARTHARPNVHAPGEAHIPVVTRLHTLPDIQHTAIGVEAAGVGAGVIAGLPLLALACAGVVGGGVAALAARPTTGTTGVPTWLVSLGVLGLLQLSKKSSSPPSFSAAAAAGAFVTPSSTTLSPHPPPQLLLIQPPNASLVSRLPGKIGGAVFMEELGKRGVPPDLHGAQLGGGRAIE
ncbi:hypothetical protein B0H19DRAFT_1334942 [Mycena capillaripes]|nr:hypothetical protein B0H19DRAFT_1334942 [Mycena capillaripes]